MILPTASMMESLRFTKECFLLPQLLPNLEELDLSGLPLNDETLRHIVNKFPRIRALTFTAKNTGQSISIHEDLSGLASLERLHLEFAGILGRVPLEALARRMPHLKMAVLLCSLATDTILLELCDNAPFFRWIRLLGRYSNIQSQIRETLIHMGR